MGAVKTFILCFASFALFAQVAQADPVPPWTWWVTSSGLASAYAIGGPTQNTLSALSTSSAPTATASSAPMVTASSAPAPAPTTYSAYSAPTAQPAQTIAPPTGSQTTPADAFVNFGSGPYANANLITNSTPQPWYNSPQITGFFGGQPTAQQQTDFANAVLQDVKQTFQLSGVPVNLTNDPTVPAAHTLSVVSNTAAKLDPTAIGMTEIGGSGFSFINNIGPSAQNLTQLQWIVAHNVAHELMLAFGVPEDYDTTGNYIDARNASWSMMVNPNSTFSPEAAQALLARNFQSNVDYATQGAQIIDPAPVPEPATIAIWALAGTALVFHRKFRSRRAAA